MWDGDVFRAWQILLFKQRVPSSNLSRQGWDKWLRFVSSGAPGTQFHPSKQTQPFFSAAKNRNRAQHCAQEGLSSCQPGNGSRKMEKTLLGPQESQLWEQPQKCTSAEAEKGFLCWHHAPESAAGRCCGWAGSTAVSLCLMPQTVLVQCDIPGEQCCHSCPNNPL